MCSIHNNVKSRSPNKDVFAKLYAKETKAFAHYKKASEPVQKPKRPTSAQRPFIPRVAQCIPKDMQKHQCCSSACKRANESLSVKRQMTQREFSPIGQKQVQEREQLWGVYKELVRNFKHTQSSTDLLHTSQSSDQKVLAVTEYFTTRTMCEDRKVLPTAKRDESYESKIQMRNNILQQLSQRRSGKLCELEQLTPCKDRGKKVLKKPEPRIGPSIVERSEIWRRLKEAKIKSMQNVKEEKGMDECTFRPKRVTENSALAQEYENAVARKDSRISTYTGRRLPADFNSDHNSYSELYKMKKLITPTAKNISPIKDPGQYSAKAQDCKRFLF